MFSPYIQGNFLTLKINHLGSKHAPQQLNTQTGEVRAKVTDVIEPSTMSIVVVLELEQRDRTSPCPRMALKIYDRQFSPELREFKETGPATTLSEDEYTGFLRLGSMSQFMVDYEENGQWAYDDWDVPQREAYFYAEATKMHDIELEVYDRLVDLQGTHVPKFLADVRLTPQHAATGLDENLAKYTEIKAILIEYIPGFPLADLVKRPPESDWPAICNQAIEAARKMIDHDFINLDLSPRNMLLHRDEELKYRVCFIDFAQCRFRDLSDSDEVWRERKRQTDEEGAVGYRLETSISFAKGKKGKKYKGTAPLPWTYTPSSCFEGEYIELYSQAE
jgi:serine/threonine protein kinase